VRSEHGLLANLLAVSGGTVKKNAKGALTMNQVWKGQSNRLAFVAAILMAGAAAGTMRATEWQAVAGQETPDRASQALAYLPNEMWIHTGDSIRWTFPTHERHTVSFLKPGQTRPPGFGPTFGVLAGCPGVTPDGSSFDGSECVTSDILLLAPDAEPGAGVPSYSVQFPTAGNFKLVCLVHPDMTGVIHVLDSSEDLPHTQEFYDREAQKQRAELLAEASRPEGGRLLGDQDRGPGNRRVVAGTGLIVTTTGAGSQTVSWMRFRRATITVRVGDTVEWTSLDPSINHTVTFGTEPADPRPPSPDVQLAVDGARQAVINSPTQNVNSGFLSPAPQDRVGLPQTLPGITRFRVTFTSPGIFDYICAIHDDLGMKGRVIVY
jgi:plastocyanin